ncbi:hypothetical protein EXIGLDRAFT_752081 [Exidia glandulosa HHB12029]|uniref:CENP-V/GFA domain-containing protein n=1 Tax=Exidia glandulosa HHB12029 TaxID=1314781 RepID=A0A165EUN2_EXIGL|nr:hypothetical protein EXIGLDRAFT_752081 [Exidia glandulosa HHB12029]
MSTTIQGGCHCGSVRYKFSVESSTLPLDADYCHCDDCRLTIGGFCGLYVEAPVATFTLTGTGALVRYNSSSRLTRTHCSKCGTSITADDNKGVKVSVIVSTFDLFSGVAYDSLVKPVYHIFVKDTWRGGVTTIIDDGLPRYKAFKQDGLWMDDAVTKSPSEEIQPTSGGEITGGCHCKGIQFTVRRAPDTWADDPVLVKWIKHGNRFSAIHCFCDTCRQVSGAPFWTWAFVPYKLITFTSNSTERIYRSSATKPCERRFCGTCGCTFSYTASPGFEMWDMSVATFDQTKVEEWLSFRPAPAGEDLADEALGSYIHGWLDSPERRPISYAVDGEKYNPTP